MLKHNNPTIEIVRKDHKLISVKAIMPIWTRIGANGVTYIRMPLLGINTYGKGADDIELAINECLHGYLLIAEECGLGLESELEFFGWEKTSMSTVEESSVYTIGSKPYMGAVIETGEERAFGFNVSNENELELA